MAFFNTVLSLWFTCTLVHKCDTTVIIFLVLSINFYSNYQNKHESWLHKRKQNPKSNRNEKNLDLEWENKIYRNEQFPSKDYSVRPSLHTFQVYFSFFVIRQAYFFKRINQIPNDFILLNLTSWEKLVSELFHKRVFYFFLFLNDRKQSGTCGKSQLSYLRIQHILHVW